MTYFLSSAWQNLFPLFPAPSLTLFVLVWEWLHGEGNIQTGSLAPLHRTVRNRLAGFILRLWLPLVICAVALADSLPERSEGMCVLHVWNALMYSSGSVRCDTA